MQSKWKPRRFEIFVVAGLIFGLCFVLFFAFERARNIKRSSLCQSNMKQIGLAAMQYMRDYDEKCPIANRWSEALLPYCQNDAIFHCPSVMKFGYSMNTHLSGLRMTVIDDSRNTPMYFDSSILKKFQHDAGQSWLQESRHPQGNAVVFTDGHAELQMKKPLFRAFAPLPKPKPQKKPRKIIR